MFRHWLLIDFATRKYKSSFCFNTIIYHVVNYLCSKLLKMDIQTEKRDVGRPYKIEAIGRVKLTTSVQPHLKRWLKEYATNTGQTIADILEDAIIEYRQKHDPKE